MKRAIPFFITIFFLVPSKIMGNENSLINRAFIPLNLTYKAHWSHLHDATEDDLGGAWLYYGLVCAAKASVCVCLGSGDGFVPRVMRQAQRDSALLNSQTILVDGNRGPWGRPQWLDENSFLRKKYPEIKIIIDTTARVAQSWPKELCINYLHIDADRTTSGALQDFLDYLPFMAKPSIITLHDVAGGRPCARTVQLIKEMGYEVVRFETIGTGVALIRIY